MLSVLALVTDAFGGRGGIAQAARDVIEAFATQDLIEHITVLPRRVPDSPLCIHRKVSQSAAASGRINYAMKAILEVIRSRPDIIFCNHLYMAPLAAITARLIGAKLFIQLHGIEIWKEPTTTQRTALERADAILCVSRDTRARALTYCDIKPERAVVLNNTFATRFKPGDRQAARTKFALGEEFALLTVGRIDSRERYKGHDAIIEALPRLTGPDGRKVIFIIAGTGDDRTRLETLAKKADVFDQVRFLGYVPYVELPDLYRAADLFALISTGEGFGIAFLEALASGTPAIGLASGGSQDALGEGQLGTLVTHDKHLEESLELAISSSSSDKRRATTEVETRFGVDSFRLRLSLILSAFATSNAWI